MCGFEVQVHVPAERSDSQDEAIERIHVGSATQARDEREAAAVQAARGERFELPVSHPLVDISDASIAAATLGDRIEDHSVVATVRGGVDNDGALDADARVQGFESRQRGFGWRVRTRRSVGIFRDGTEDVAVRVARQRRGMKRRRSRGRIRSGDCRRELGALCLRANGLVGECQCRQSPGDMAKPRERVPAVNQSRHTTPRCASTSRSP